MHPPPKYGSGMWMNTWVVQREENKQNFPQHINSIDPAIKFTVEDNKEDGPSPSWPPLSNQRLMVSYLSLYIESLPTQMSIYNGIATITSQLSIV